MPENYGTILGQQLGSQASGGVLGGVMDMAFQGWRNSNQLKQNKKLLAQQVEAQKQMGIFNREQAMQMWNDTNYGAQMKHLKGAGLNAALLYGGSGGGGTTAGTPAGSVGGTAADARAGGGYTGMNIMTASQARLMEAQARNLDADTAMKSGVQTEQGYATIEQLKAQTSNTKAQTSLTKIQTQIAEIDKQIKDATSMDVIKINDLTAQKIQQEVFQLRNQTDISDGTKNTMIQTIKQQYVNTVISSILMKSNINLNSAQIQKMSADIVQKGRELDIKQFEAEIEANQPGVGKVLGGMVNSIKTEVDKILGIDENIASPRKVNK